MRGFERSSPVTDQGVRDHTNDENPFKDWHHVFIPSCGGSGHWGDATFTYGTGKDAFTVHFNGTANTRASLAWIFENITAPERPRTLLAEHEGLSIQ